MRHKTFSELWPDMAQMDADSEMETGPGEYYLDSLAVMPSCRHHGIGKALLLDGIRKGRDLGYDQIALVADGEMQHLIRLYESIGFVPADQRHVFGVDFQRMIYKI
jgi:ribosomal protein S18 acetylase RimI-like enzyme